MNDLEKDSLFALAERYVQETGISVFLTGKAGTGKTTFLREIVSTTTKRCAVLAPTGIAAINAGGVTIHSFFQLPLCPYLPDVKELVTEYQMPEKFRSLRKNRIKILRTLDLLVIDEISMVRADIMDAMDATLRRYRRNDKPFGGVQLLMIGDIQQLPPVVKENERQYMEQVYPSPFFFNSKALSKMHYIVVELEKVYRQRDRDFIGILNDVRTGKPGQKTLDLLNRRLDRDFVPPEDERWIRLTTHNSQADTVNEKKMAALDGEEAVFEASIEGQFPENAYPAETRLKLKVGAQVMFIRNDSSGDGRYYNGKIATVAELSPDIVVEDEEGHLITVQKEVWENIRYELDPEDNEIKGYNDGTFEQFPLRLAWAITIHKSQGLTFDRVIIDAAWAFSFGQVYVALSRCRSLDGIVLSSPITERCTFSSEEVSGFEDSYTPAEQAKAQLKASINGYRSDMLCEAFDLQQVRYFYNRINRLFQVDLFDKMPEKATEFRKHGERVRFLSDTAKKFQSQIRQISARDDNDLLRERVLKASGYYKAQLSDLAGDLAPLLLAKVEDKEAKAAFKAAAQELLKELGFKIALCSKIEEEGFDVSEYNKMKTDALLAEPDALRTMVRKLKK